MMHEHAHHHPVHATPESAHATEEHPVGVPPARFHARGTIPPAMTGFAPHAHSPTDPAYAHAPSNSHGKPHTPVHDRPRPAHATSGVEGGGLHLGDASLQVAELQQLLAATGFYHGAIGGHFGPQTEAALRAFQHAHGLDESGRADATTMEQLRAAVPAQGGPAEGAAAPAAGNGGAASAISYGMSVLGAPYAAINPYRFGEVLWPGGSKEDIHGKVRGPFAPGTQVFDCSGFVAACWKRGGVDLQAMSLASSDAVVNNKNFLIEVDPAQLQPGDLIAYSGHIVMYVGNDRVLQSTPDGGVQVSPAGKFLKHSGAVCKRVPA